MVHEKRHLRCQYLHPFCRHLETGGSGRTQPLVREYTWRLAEIIILDQYSRNLHRGSPLAFVQDGMALVLVQETTKQPDSPALDLHERQLILPAA